MNRSAMIVGLCATILALAGLVYAEEEEGSGAGQTGVRVQVGGQRGVEVDVRHGQSGQAGRMQDQAQQDLQSGKFVVRRLSDMYGKNFYDGKGEKVGDLKNVAIDTQTGQIAFAIVEFDASMDLEKNWVAIPWSAIHKEVDPQNYDKIGYSMEIDKNKLQQAKGFDEDKWPNLADRNISRELYALFGQRPYWEGATARAAQEPAIVGTPISPEKERERRAVGMARESLIIKGSELVGHNVLDQNNQEFAELEEIMADPKSGHLIYGIVQIDQAPDFSKDYMYPVPWQVINVKPTGHREGMGEERETGQTGQTERQPGQTEQLRTETERQTERMEGMAERQTGGQVLTDSGKFQLVLNVSRDKLKNGPKFGEREWPNMTTQWGEQVFNHYGVRPLWKTGAAGERRPGAMEQPGERTGGQTGQD